MLLIAGYMLVGVLTFLIMTTLFFYWVNGIAPTPSSYKVRTVLNQTLPEEVAGDIIEAGAGFGGMALWLAQRYPYNTVYAWENAWLPFGILWLRVKASPCNNVRVCYGCFQHQSLDNAGLIYTFLCRKGMRTVRRWVARYPQAQLLLVSHVFLLPEQQVNGTINVSGWMGDQLHFYRFVPSPLFIRKSACLKSNLPLYQGRMG